MTPSTPKCIGAPLRLVALLLAVLLAGAACTATPDAASDDVAGAQTPTGTDEPNSGSPADSEPSNDGDSTDAVSGPETGVVDLGSGSLADLITELPPAPTGLPVPEAPRRQPIGLTIDALGIDVATVIDVGVEENGDMEIPPADEVGWYGFGPTPGDVGSSVLAAHIAFDGENGVFVNLDKLELGSVIRVTYDDGTTSEFEAVSKEQYDKDELPDSIFARDGDPRLVLITCGGDFNRQVSSYEDNVVIYANPINRG